MDILLRKNRELSAILQVSQMLTSSFDLEGNLNAAMEILAGQLEMQRGCVFLLDQWSKDLKIVAAYGLSRKAIEKGNYRIGEGIVGQVIETNEPMFIPNIGIEPKFLNKTDSRPQKSGISFLCMPIALENEPLGVITVDRIYAAEKGNVDDDLRVLSIIASFIAQFVRLWEHFRRTESECGDLRSQLTERFSLPNIVGESPPLQQVLKAVRKVAATDTTVLLLGETGTGKELIAQTLHYQSRRAKNSFVAVNLAALPENLIEAELFGVEKGAYTGATARRVGRFEMAHQGTIFLDEIGELPAAMQVKLLRVLQEKTFERIGASESVKVDARIVTATHRNLLEEVAQGRFREDLYWRLNVVPIVLPPLRERGDDVITLVDFYVKKFNKAYGLKVELDASAKAAFQTYSWPGNVRELANMVERLIIMAEKPILTAADLPGHLHEYGTSIEVPDASQGNNANLGGEVEQLERRHIVHALKQTSGIQQRASQVLGITPRQLAYRIKKYGIDIRAL